MSLISSHKIAAVQHLTMILKYPIQPQLELHLNQEQLPQDSKGINSTSKTINKTLQFLITKVLKNPKMKVVEMESCSQRLLLNLQLTAITIRRLLSSNQLEIPLPQLILDLRITTKHRCSTISIRCLEGALGSKKRIHMQECLEVVLEVE